MNPLYHPRLELCRKLQEIGFPDTYMCMVVLWEDYTDILEYSSSTNWYNDEVEKCVCPSVMEMLSVMPKVISEKLLTYTLNINSDWTDYDVSYSCYNNTHSDIFYISTFYSCYWELPNALAEMVLWLYENKYITFNNGN